MPKKVSEVELFGEDEIARRRDEVVRRMANCSVKVIIPPSRGRGGVIVHPQPVHPPLAPRTPRLASCFARVERTLPLKGRVSKNSDRRSFDIR
jgi:hypothetical protein